ncbi:MAG: hypothetical protein GTO22_03040, partial [Gemmatimonadales bacterium]|nr:hypothetical protein [Gemmatimonadales bacterium]
MRTRPTVLYFSPEERPVPDLISAWVQQQPIPLTALHDIDEVETTALRSPPALIIIDADGAGSVGVELCRSLKGDPYTAIVPVAFVSGGHASEDVRKWFESGADEVLTPILAPDEQRSRLGVLLSRTERNVAV